MSASKPWDNMTIVPVAKTPQPWDNMQIVSQNHDEIIQAASKKYNLDPHWLRAQIKIESNFQNNAKSEAGAEGLMQLMPATALALGVKNVYDPKENIFGGAKLMRENLDRKDVAGDYVKASLMYHGSPDQKKWGARSFAYPYLILEEYRKSGGRLHDPDVPKASRLDVAADAAIPFVSAPKAIMALTQGRGPNLSQGLSGPDAGLPVGQKLKNWWNAPSRSAPARERFDKSIANAQEERPWETLGIQAIAGLPGQALLGGGVNKLLQGVGQALPRLQPVTNFLSGTAGHGLPGTAEGASFGARIASRAAQGSVQGGVAGASVAHLDPERDMGEQALSGAALGGVIGGVGGVVAEGAGKALFRGKIEPKVAELGLEAIGKRPNPAGLPPVKLYSDSGQVNRLSVEENNFNRIAASTYGEKAAPAGAQEVDRVASRIGQMIERGAKGGEVKVDGVLLNQIIDIAQDNIDLAKHPRFKDVVQELYSAARVGVMSGERYEELTRRGGKLASLVNSKNSLLAIPAREMKEALWDALERGTNAKLTRATRQGNSRLAQEAAEALRLLSEGRKQWRAFSTVQEIADPVTGAFPPGKLLSAADKHTGNFNRYGGGDIGQAANIGSKFDPAARRPASARAYWPAVTAGVSAIHAPVTTGAVAATALGTMAAGSGLQKAIGSLPGYPNWLLERSARQAPGAIQRRAGETLVPLLSAHGQRLMLSPPENKR